MTNVAAGERPSVERCASLRSSEDSVNRFSKVIGYPTNDWFVSVVLMNRSLLVTVGLRRNAA